MHNTYLVTKANTLIRSHYKLSLEEQKIITTLVSLIQPQDEDFKPYEFKIAEFMQLLGVSDKSLYTRIPNITKGLMKKVFEIQEGDELLQIAWICAAKYNKGKGTVTLKFTPDLKPYLLGLKELFTPYRLENVLSLTGQYSIRLYELLKSYEFKGVWEVKVPELAQILKLTKSYSDFYDMKKRVLEPSQKELSDKTDIQFTYETITERKKVISLKFHIKSNLKNKYKKALPKTSVPAPIALTNQPEIASIQAEFKRLYSGELVDHFVAQMLAEKGHSHVWECLRSYADYIHGRNINNVAGDFFSFVMKGYEKPVPHKGNIPQRDNFDQRPYTREEYEKYYHDPSKPIDWGNGKPEPENDQKPSRTIEAAQNGFKTINQLLSNIKIPAPENKN